MKSSNNATQLLQQRVQRNLANQLETQHLQSDIEKTCIEAGYDEHIEAYASGMLEMKLAQLDPDPGLGLL